MEWTEERVKRLQALAKKGLSTSEIADAMDTTNDTISGKLKRLADGAPSKHCKALEVVKQLPAMAKEEIKSEINSVGKLWEVPKARPGVAANITKTYLVIGDVHVPYQDKESIVAVLRLMDDVKFDGLINLGDFMDLDAISHWTENKHRTLEGKRLQKDYIIGNQILDEFDKRLVAGADKRFFVGNHERFYYDMVEKLPMMEGLFDPLSELRLKDRKYKVYPEINHIERIGRLNFCHGVYASSIPVKKHLDEFKSNVLFAHVHSPSMLLASSPAKEISLFGASIGCLCHINPSYMRNMPNRWSQGFAIVYFFDDGTFDIDIKRIINGKFVYNGKVYSGR